MTESHETQSYDSVMIAREWSKPSAWKVWMESCHVTVMNESRHSTHMTHQCAWLISEITQSWRSHMTETLMIKEAYHSDSWAISQWHDSFIATVSWVTSLWHASWMSHVMTVTWLIHGRHTTVTRESYHSRGKCGVPHWSSMSQSYDCATLVSHITVVASDESCRSH